MPIVVQEGKCIVEKRIRLKKVVYEQVWEWPCISKKTIKIKKLKNQWTLGWIDGKTTENNGFARISICLS